MTPLPERPAATAPTPWFYRVLGRWMVPMERLLGIDCRSFTRLASRRMDGKTGGMDRLRYRVHRWTCALCRRQDARLRRLAEVIGLAARQERFEAGVAMPDEAKTRLRARVMEELQKGAGDV